MDVTASPCRPTASVGSSACVKQKSNYETSRQLWAKTRVLCAVALGLIWANASATAQTFTTIKNFGFLTNVTCYNLQNQINA